MTILDTRIPKCAIEPDVMQIRGYQKFKNGSDTR